MEMDNKHVLMCCVMLFVCACLLFARLRPPLSALLLLSPPLPLRVPVCLRV